MLEKLYGVAGFGERFLSSSVEGHHTSDSTVSPVFL